jgi:hypothetical protein
MLRDLRFLPVNNSSPEAVDLVFKTVSGHPINSDYLAKQFKGILEFARLPRISTNPREDLLDNSRLLGYDHGSRGVLKFNCDPFFEGSVAVAFDNLNFWPASIRSSFPSSLRSAWATRRAVAATGKEYGRG